MTSSLTILAPQCREIPTARIRFVGIYFLVIDDEIIYVGQSRDIESRIGMHRNFGTSDFERAFWIECAETDLDAYEGAFVRALSPQRTFQCASDDSRDAEILARFGIPLSAEARRDFEARRRARWRLGRRRERARRGSAAEKRAIGAWLARQLAGVES